jgi:hypothetical protein
MFGKHQSSIPTCRDQLSKRVSEQIYRGQLRYCEHGGDQTGDFQANRSGDESAETHQVGYSPKMHTSRAALNRLLDETDTSLTL